MGGVVYSSQRHQDTSISVVLVTSKAKVAHLKAITIPKTELSGARTKLLKMVIKDLNIPATHLCGWNDSQVVLGWLNKSNHRWKQFVSARVQFIINILPSVLWRYVSSRENPADHISRGLLPSEIIQCRLRWKGPPWLSRLPTVWPAVSPSLKPDELP